MPSSALLKSETKLVVEVTLRPPHNERAVDLGIGPHRLDRAIDDGSSVLLPDMAAPAAGGVVEPE